MNIKLKCFIKANISMVTCFIKDLIYLIVSWFFWPVLGVIVFLLLYDGLHYLIKGGVNYGYLLATEIAGGIVIFCVLVMILDYFIILEKNLYKACVNKCSNNVKVKDEG